MRFAKVRTLFSTGNFTMKNLASRGNGGSIELGESHPRQCLASYTILIVRQNKTVFLEKKCMLLR